MSWIVSRTARPNDLINVLQKMPVARAAAVFIFLRNIKYRMKTWKKYIKTFFPENCGFEPKKTHFSGFAFGEISLA